MLLRSIRSQLLGLVLATVIPFTALIGVGLWNQWRRDQVSAVERTINQARLLAAQVDDYLGNIDNLLIGLSQAVSPDPADTAANDALLRRTRAELPEVVSTILLYDLEGTNIGSSSEIVRRPAGDREFFRRIIDGQR